RIAPSSVPDFFPAPTGFLAEAPAKNRGSRNAARAQRPASRMPLGAKSAPCQSIDQSSSGSLCPSRASNLHANDQASVRHESVWEKSRLHVGVQEVFQDRCIVEQAELMAVGVMTRGLVALT